MFHIFQGTSIFLQNKQNKRMKISSSKYTHRVLILDRSYIMSPTMRNNNVHHGI